MLGVEDLEGRKIEIKDIHETSNSLTIKFEFADIEDSNAYKLKCFADGDYRLDVWIEES